MQTADFDAFYAATSPRLVRQVYLLGGNVPEPEDVTHEAYERAWLQWRRWPTWSRRRRGCARSPAAWL